LTQYAQAVDLNPPATASLGQQFLHLLGESFQSWHSFDLLAVKGILMVDLGSPKSTTYSFD
jgi:hypothetical protein